MPISFKEMDICRFPCTERNQIANPTDWLEQPSLGGGDSSQRTQGSRLEHYLPDSPALLGVIVYDVAVSFNCCLFSLIYNVLSICALQQSDPPIYIYILSLSHNILHHIPLKVAMYNSLCYTAGSHCSSTPNATVCIYQPQMPSPSHSLLFPSGKDKSVLQVHESVSFL